MSATDQPTPMFRQYRAIKADHPETILLFRMGDFYEMFYDDAREASRLLDLTLTARGKGSEHVVPMCGFPHHQLDAYAAKLVLAGRRVAVCDQVEDPRQAKGLVKREVVRVLTPGTIVDAAALEPTEHSWAAAVAVVGSRIGAAFLEATTGEFLAWESSHDADGWAALSECLASFHAREIVHAEGLRWPEGGPVSISGHAALAPLEPYAFAVDVADDLLRRHFGVASLDGFGLRERPAAVAAAGALLQYLLDTHRSGLQHVDRLSMHDPANRLVIDAATRRNLELERSIRDGSRRGTLLATLDDTRTAAGARLLRTWLLAPLVDRAEIVARLDAVEEWTLRSEVRIAVRERLDGVHDIERSVARAVAGTAGPRDLAGLRASLDRIPGILETIGTLSAPLTRATVDDLDPCADVRDVLARGLSDDPPASARDPGIVRAGFDAELDGLCAMQADGRSFLAALEERERAATGIASLKVRFTKVFGYYIEVSRPNLALVPDTYQRKQTIAGGERFVTPELKELEERILHASERAAVLEAELFARIRAQVARAASRLNGVARACAVLDVLSTLADVAVRRSWNRPVVDDGLGFRIGAGRHPVVEEALGARAFVPNDTDLDASSEAIAIVTGPNMGGKSTYLRQNAVHAILAQTGSFVPADSAHLGIVDRVFCRVGASDSLAEGQSTFMVEMSETAHILHHATRRSLVVLDEIGRGTSTFDGLAIAWSVVEHLHDRPDGPCRTLFATHYHELTELAVQLPGVVNYRMAVRERGDSVVFTHRVERGPADRSYGIHVARLAGVPSPVIRRAAEILHNLEDDAYGRDGLPRIARTSTEERAPTARQARLFGWDAAPAEPPSDPAASEVLAELRSRDPHQMTPLEALALLDAWRRRLRG